MMRAAALLLALALSGCVTYQTKGDGLARTRIGEGVRVDGPRVTPLKVLADSRCPQKTLCVWAGEVRVSARIETGRGVEERELVLGKPEPVTDGTLELVEVYPPREAETTIYPDEYRFAFRFAGGL